MESAGAYRLHGAAARRASDPAPLVAPADVARQPVEGRKQRALVDPAHVEHALDLRAGAAGSVPLVQVGRREDLGGTSRLSVQSSSRVDMPWCWAMASHSSGVWGSCPRCGRAWRMNSASARSSCRVSCGTLRAARFSLPMRPAAGRSASRTGLPSCSGSDSPWKIQSPVAQAAARRARSSHESMRSGSRVAPAGDSERAIANCRIRSRRTPSPCRRTTSRGGCANPGPGR